jgi:hypothetical protein
MSMDRKEFELMREYLRKQAEEVKTSKKAAMKLLIETGFLTTRGTIRKNARPARPVKP